MFSHIPAPTPEELTIAGYINDVQFMTDCWSRDFKYAEYAFHAARVNKYVHTEEQYLNHCAHMEAEMAEYHEAGVIQDINKPL